MQVQPGDVDYTLEPFVNLSPTQINCHVASQDLYQPKNDDVILYKKYPESTYSVALMHLVKPNA